MKENLSRNSLLYFAILALGFVLFIMLIPQASESLFSHKQNALKKISLEETVKFPSSEASQRFHHGICPYVVTDESGFAGE